MAVGLMNALRTRLLRWLGVPADLRDQLDTLHTATLRNTTALAQVRRAQTADRARIDHLTQRDPAQMDENERRRRMQRWERNDWPEGAA